MCVRELSCLIACDTVKYGSWWLSKGTPAEVLYKGTITRIIGEDSPSRAEKVREDALPKGHVIYEGKKGHVLSYDGKLESSVFSRGARPTQRNSGGGKGHVKSPYTAEQDILASSIFLPPIPVRWSIGRGEQVFPLESMDPILACTLLTPGVTRRARRVGAP